MEYLGIQLIDLLIVPILHESVSPIVMLKVLI